MAEANFLRRAPIRCYSNQAVVPGRLGPAEPSPYSTMAVRAILDRLVPRSNRGRGASLLY